MLQGHDGGGGGAAAGERVVPAVAVKLVDTVAVEEGVVTVARRTTPARRAVAVDRVRAGATLDQVVARIAFRGRPGPRALPLTGFRVAKEELVVPTLAVEEVSASAGADDVVACSAGQDVVRPAGADDPILPRRPLGERDVDERRVPRRRRGLLGVPVAADTD
jgi:hypothetical protein